MWLAAGAGLCRRDVVERIATRAPDVIRWLQAQSGRLIKESN